VPEASGGRVRLILADHFKSEARVICEPSHVDSVVKRGVSRGSEGS
jgi:hypothetical protein